MAEVRCRDVLAERTSDAVARPAVRRYRRLIVTRDDVRLASDHSVEHREDADLDRLLQASVAQVPAPRRPLVP